MSPSANYPQTWNVLVLPAVFATGHGQAAEPPPPSDGTNMELLQRVIKIEAVIPTLATKEDLEREIGGLRTELNKEVGGLRADMHKEFNLQTWRIFTFGAALVAVVYYIARYVPIK